MLALADNLSVAIANLEQTVAWKNGVFVFDHDNIEGIMRQLSRWYDVEVIYEGKTSGKMFAGSISRYRNIEQVLNTIAYIGTVRFKIEGKRVIVIAN